MVPFLAAALLLASCAHRSRPLSPTEAARAGDKTTHAIPVMPLEATPIQKSAEPSTAHHAWGNLPHPEFQWPLERITVINYYGWRGRRRMHEGLDLRAAKNTPVYAAAAGTIIHAGRGIRGYGRLVVIDHGSEWSTVYGHLNKFAVKAGERVKAGELIGYSGRTGRAQGPHLHFEIRKDADPLDPLIFLGRE